jgi:hypothetical protein
LLAGFSQFAPRSPGHRRLDRIGASRVLEAGNPEGITLLGVAHNVAPQYEFPIDDIKTNLPQLHERLRVAFDAGEAQALTGAAYELWYSGRREPAVRLGAMVPSMLPRASAEQWFAGLEGAVTPGTKEVYHTSRQIFEKGYAAANLLVDSGAVSVEDMWNSLDREIVGPSQELKAPGRVSYWARSLRSSLADPAELGPPDPSFFFALEGDGARCDEALWGTEFDLVFRYVCRPPARSRAS